MMTDTHAEREAATRTASPCNCGTDPYTWMVSDPLDGLVICFGCRTCGAAWTRTAPEPLQKQHARIQARKDRTPHRPAATEELIR